jgi:hypothetical protein
MKKFLTGGFRAALAAFLAVVVASAARAQEPAAPAAQPAQEGGDAFYYRPAPEKATTLTLAQQKAQMRGAQRMARLEALRWYGFSNSRPTASAIAWTTMYSPAWQMPGGRPYAWYTSSRPVVIINAPAPVYR